MSDKSNLRGESMSFFKGLKKRGQLTLFVMMSIVIVAGVIIYLFWIQPTYFDQQIGGLDFDSCVNDAVVNGIVELSSTGGVIDSGFSYLYQGVDVPYFCYTNLPYQTCVVQQPLVKQYFEKQLITYLEEEVNVCYENSVDELKSLGYNVTTGEVELNFTIIPGRVVVDVYAPTTVEGQRFEDYKMNVDSSIYDILMVVTSLLQYEASFGDASTSELMFYYPEIVIDKFKQVDSTTIYIVGEKGGDIKFQFASRSLIWPAGYDMINYVRSEK